MTIFDVVKKFAEQKSRGSKLSVYHVLYGISTTVSLKDEMVFALTQSENVTTEMQAIRQTMEEMGIDLVLLKTGITHILVRLSGTNLEDKNTENLGLYIFFIRFYTQEPIFDNSSSKE